ncbi:MAG TPA: MFS transporter [Acetobacteraceae bacterium]|jgi:MFS family permease|nr:MFS transporter [Acetobacteraceae bacterium]
MFAWLRDLNAKERRTMAACFAGWTLDGFDGQLYSYVVPTVIALWGISAGAAGTIGTVTLLTSSLGGWLAGALADRFGRVRVLQVAILWYSVMTFLCGFAQNFEQLFILRALHGLGFGGEWAAGAVLMGEVIRDKYRGRGVGFVQTGAAIGPGAAALVYAGLYAVLPEAIAWRALFVVGLLPALLVLWIRRNIGESEAYEGRRAEARPAGATHLFSAFRGPYLWTTIKVSVMVAGAQGGVYAVQFWMPTYLRTVRHLSASSTGAYVAVQMLGALIGFLLGAYLSDAIGRKWTFFLSAAATFVMVVLFMFVPMGNTTLLLAGIPLSAAILMKFSPMGPYMTELYPTEVRGTGQGFCYNGGRAIGAFFPTMVGFATQVMPLGPAIALFCGFSCILMSVMLLMLPETRGRDIASLEAGTISAGAPGE